MLFFFCCTFSKIHAWKSRFLKHVPVGDPFHLNLIVDGASHPLHFRYRNKKYALNAMRRYNQLEGVGPHTAAPFNRSLNEFEALSQVPIIFYYNADSSQLMVKNAGELAPFLKAKLRYNTDLKYCLSVTEDQKYFALDECQRGRREYTYGHIRQEFQYPAVVSYKLYGFIKDEPFFHCMTYKGYNFHQRHFEVTHLETQCDMNEKTVDNFYLQETPITAAS